MQILLDFFANKNFIPHGYCLSWNSALLWLHVVSDLLITLSYYSIPLSLAYFVRQRKDLPYGWLIAMGGLFIIACGTTHLMSVVLIWIPLYWLDGFLKAFTSLVSVATALAMLRVIPLALKLSTPVQLQAEIDQRKQAQAALELVNTRFQALFENMRNGVAVYEAIDNGNDFVFRDFNHAAELLDGIKREELLNKPVTQVFPNVETFGLLTVLRRVWQTGQAESLPLSFYHDGRLAVYRENYVYRLPSGEVVAVYEDVTSQKQAQQAQQIASERLHKIANQLPSVVFQFVMRADGSFCVPYASEALRRIYRLSPEEVIEDATPLFAHVHPDDLARHLEGIRLSAAHLSPWKDEYRLKFPDGSEHWCWGNALPQPEADGSTLWHGFVMDVTERKHVEIALQEREKELFNSKLFFQRLTQVNPIGIYQTDAQGQCIFVNEKWCEIAGMSYEQAQGSGWRNAIMPEDRDSVYSEWEKAVRERRLFKHEYRFQQPNGTIIWVYGLSTPIHDEQGSISSYIGTITDINDRKRVEKALLDSEFRWKFAIEGSGDGVWDWNIQTNEALYSNRWIEMLGYAPTDILPSFSEWASRIHHEDAVHVTEVLTTYLAGKSDVYQVEFRLQCKDTRYKWILARGILVSRSDDGKPLRMIGTHTDITERKQIEEKLRQSEARQRAIIETEPECIKIVDAEGRLIQMNPAGLAMIEADSFEHVAGKPVLNVIAPEYRAAFADLHQRVIAGENMQLQYEVLGLKGGRRWLETHAVPMLENGKVVQLAVTRDITARKKAEQQLRELNRDFVTFLENTSDFIYFKDQDSRIRFCSQTLATITHHKNWRDLVGTHIERLLSSKKLI